jgi:sugar phosphate isomerase/epimerase
MRVVGPMDNAGVVFDISHVLMGSMPFNEYFSIVKDRIIHVHACDAIGQKEHMVIGRGKIDFHEPLKLLRDSGYKGAVIIENMPIMADILESRSSLERVFKDIF